MERKTPRGAVGKLQEGKLWDVSPSRQQFLRASWQPRTWRLLLGTVKTTLIALTGKCAPTRGRKMEDVALVPLRQCAGANPRAADTSSACAIVARVAAGSSSAGTTAVTHAAADQGSYPKTSGPADLA